METAAHPAGQVQDDVSIYQRTLRAAFNRAVTWHLIEANPFVGVETPKTETSRRALSLQDVQQLLTVIEEDWYRIFLQFLLYTGCRRNEILFLTTDDLDTKRWILRVTADKTGQRLELPVNKALQRVTNTTNFPSGYLFESTKRPGHPWDPDWVTHKFKQVLRRAGLPESHSLHSLRHTYTTFLREKGVPRDIIQTLLGHTSPGTTAIYDHSDALYFRQWADLVDFEGNT